MTSAIGTSSYGTLDRMLASAGSLRDQYATLQQQTTSGLVSQSYAGLASVSSQVLDLTAATSQNDAYTHAITQAQGKASVMQNALSQLSTLVSSMATSALSVSGSTSASAVTSMAQQAGQALSQLVSVLNTTYGGDYVFAGADTSHAPAALAPLTPLPSPGATFSVSFAASVTVQIGPSQSVILGSSATSGAISSIVQQLVVMANSTSPANSTAMQTAAATLTSAGDTLAQGSGQIGLAQNAMTAATASYSSMQTILASQLSGLVNVDMATAISHLQTVNSQLQASYKVLGEVSSLNLASFL
jgi:flagellar hook-associated protein 3 FlgL